MKKKNVKVNLRAQPIKSLTQISSPSQLIAHRVVQNEIIIFPGLMTEYLLNVLGQLRPHNFSPDTLLNFLVYAAGHP